MRSESVLLFFVIFLLLSPSVHAVEIKRCTNISASDVYLLMKDIFATEKDVCFNISASDVVLDCQGHLVNGTGKRSSYALYSLNEENITLRNCNIKNFDFGAYFYNTTYSVIKNNSFESGVLHSSIFIGSGCCNSVLDNRVRNSGGFYICDGSYNNTINNNYFRGRFGFNQAIYLDGVSNHNTINNNEIDNFCTGIMLEHTFYNVLGNNTIRGNVNCGTYASGIVVMANTNDSGGSENNSIYHTQIEDIAYGCAVTTLSPGRTKNKDNVFEYTIFIDNVRNICVYKGDANITFINSSFLQKTNSPIPKEKISKLVVMLVINIIVLLASIIFLIILLKKNEQDFRKKKNGENKRQIIL